MRILLVYNSTRMNSSKWYQEIAAQAPEGVTVETFCITPAPQGAPYPWEDLDEKWHLKETILMRLYRQLVNKAKAFDVLINYNGGNLHPEVLESLSTFNVYSCFDDPESSDWLSAPVANKYDAVFHGNIASIFQYQHWGCKNFAFLPIFTTPSDVPTPNEYPLVNSTPRLREIVFIGDNNHWRRQRLEALSASFPQANIYGTESLRGKVSEEQKRSLYLDSQIGWNIHKSAGPNSRRLYELAAYGVLQICDNKTGLGQIFRLGEEVIGFDTIQEAIELTQYFLKNDSERRAITERAYDRYWRDYSTTAIWRRIIQQLNDWGAEPKSPQKGLPTWSVPKIFVPVAIITKRKLKQGKSLAKCIRDHLRQKKTKPVSFDERAYLGEIPAPYTENPEMAHVNMAQTRLNTGEPFEWPNIVALNWAVTSRIGKARRIVEIGSGTGAFAEYASIDVTRTIYCIEGDDFAREKSIELRSRPNVHYYKCFQDCPEKQFDLLVSIEVIEHIDQMPEFLKFCLGLAPRAIFSTPNRTVVRSPEDFGPPAYEPHVREFDPGELYWILRQYYAIVRLFYMPNEYVPWLAPMTIVTQGTPIIAECTEPYLSQH